MLFRIVGARCAAAGSRPGLSGVDRGTFGARRRCTLRPTYPFWNTVADSRACARSLCLLFHSNYLSKTIWRSSLRCKRTGILSCLHPLHRRSSWPNWQTCADQWGRRSGSVPLAGNLQRRRWRCQCPECGWTDHHGIAMHHLSSMDCSWWAFIIDLDKYKKWFIYQIMINL